MIQRPSEPTDFMGLLDALARTMEPAAYRRLLSRVTLDRPVESLADARALFRTVGLELEAPDAFGGRINAGVELNALAILTSRFPRPLGFVVHKDRVVVLMWKDALREWVRKIDRE